MQEIVPTMKSSRQKRLESKKRKAAAFLQIAQLNDDERIEAKAKSKSIKKAKLDNESSSDSDLPNNHINVDALSESKTTIAQKPNGSTTVLTETEKKPFLHGEEYEELKKRLKERKKALQAIPQFTLKSIGHEAEISMHESYRTPLFMKDLQHLLLYALMGTKAPVEPSRWCKINSWSKLSNIVCMVVEGLDVKQFCNWKNKYEKFSKEVASIFPSQLEFISPSVYEGSVADDLSILPLSTNQKEKLKAKYGSIELALNHGNGQSGWKTGDYFKVLRSVFPMAELEEVKRQQQNIKKSKMSKLKENETNKDNKMSLKLQLLLSVSQMIEESYPIPMKGAMSEKYSDYVMTNNDGYLPLNEESPLFSVDCEMCLTSIGKNELTRVCVIDQSLKVVYHSLVLPENPITNYLTQFSGITKSTLEGVTKRLKDVQEDLRKLLPRDAILVGQSLNSDLHALKMMHPYVIDTSVIYNVTGNRSRKTKLSVLSHMFLGQDIQKEGRKGHDPEEDARAAMKLVLLKLEKGYEFGDVLLDGSMPNHHSNVADSRGNILSTSMFTPVKNNQQKVCIVANKDIINKYQNYAAKVVNVPEDGGKSCVKNKESGSNKSESKNEDISLDEQIGDEITFDISDTKKDTLSKACSQCFDNNLTICHLDFTSKISKLSKDIEESSGKNTADFTEKPFHPDLMNTHGNEDEKECENEKKLVKKVRKMTKRLWSHTSVNGMFITVWPGSKTQNAFVGIAINKEPL